MGDNACIILYKGRRFHNSVYNIYRRHVGGIVTVRKSYCTAVFQHNTTMLPIRFGCAVTPRLMPQTTHWFCGSNCLSPCADFPLPRELGFPACSWRPAGWGRHCHCRRRHTWRHTRDVIHHVFREWRNSDAPGLRVAISGQLIRDLVSKIASKLYGFVSDAFLVPKILEIAQAVYCLLSCFWFAVTCGRNNFDTLYN